MAEMKQEYESMKITKEKLEEEMERLKRNYDDNIATVESEAHLQTLTSPGQQGNYVKQAKNLKTRTTG